MILSLNISKSFLSFIITKANNYSIKPSYVTQKSITVTLNL